MPVLSKIARYRALVRQLLAIAAAVELLAAGYTALIGAIHWTVGPLRISARSPFRPLVIGVICAGLSIWLRDRSSVDRTWHQNRADFRPAKGIAWAVCLVSGSLMLLQTSFTRLISYKLFYHFVFLAIALALLGLGAAGAFVATRREPRNLDRTLRRWLAVLAVLTPVSFLMIANPPITTQSELPSSCSEPTRCATSCGARCSWWRSTSSVASS